MSFKESVVQRKLMLELQAKFPSIYVRKIAQAAYSHGGIPDLLGCYNGMFFAIEVKTTDGKLSKLQDFEIQAIDKAKGLALVCYGLEDFPYIVERIGGL